MTLAVPIETACALAEMGNNDCVTGSLPKVCSLGGKAQFAMVPDLTMRSSVVSVAWTFTKSTVTGHELCLFRCCLAHLRPVFSRERTP